MKRSISTCYCFPPFAKGSGGLTEHTLKWWLKTDAKLVPVGVELIEGKKDLHSTITEIATKDTELSLKVHLCTSPGEIKRFVLKNIDFEGY